METANKERDFDLSGGALCLDFVNTMADRPCCLKEYLTGYGDLLTFSRQAGVLDEVTSRRLGRRAARRPAAAAAVLRRAVTLREGIYRIFAAIAGGGRPDPADLEALNRALARSLRHLRVTAAGSGYTWNWSGEPDALDRMLWPITRSAGDLLTSQESSQVRECGQTKCSWLFVDRSRTRKRRWCDMATCGNRAKARRHYQRKKRRTGRSEACD